MGGGEGEGERVFVGVMKYFRHILMGHEIFSKLLMGHKIRSIYVVLIFKLRGLEHTTSRLAIKKV